ncbi:hypothetical protein TBCH5v1_2159 [Thermococcus barophilus]|uniref:Uncharacterized protein n=2 Tax=Thermococcus barophilus TaxID=55802 RepID=A0A0S1XE47_THEBA|nr:hypothetical protein TBCH5v1_2159 [Thermococcus barophilus]
MKLHEAKQKSQELVLRASTPQNISGHERCQLEVDLAYWLGKAMAYLEVESSLIDSTTLQVMLEELIEDIARDVIVEWKIERLRQLSTGQKFNEKDSFEEGVNAMKQKILEVLIPVDVSVIELSFKEQEEKWEQEKPSS